MTITVQGPDGASIQFPDGTDPGTMTAALQAHYGTPDKYKAEAADMAAKAKAGGLDTSYSLGERGLNGAMFEGLPTVMAGLTTPAEMIVHGTLNPVEGYRYAKAKQDLALKQSEDATGWGGTAADVAGGLLSGSGLAKAGLTFGKAGAGLVRGVAGMAGDGAAYGALSGALGGGDSLGDRAQASATGGALGFGLGGALPLAGAAAKAVATPVLSNIAARTNPERFAGRQAARMVSSSGQTTDALDQAINTAAAQGQPNFALADALGPAGQRGLSSVVRSPGIGSTDATAFLNNRQAGQGREMANVLAAGLGAPDTAAQRTATLEAQRSATADPLYTAYRGQDVPTTMQLAELLQRPSVAAAVPDAERLAADESKTIFAAPASDTNLPQLTAEGWDYLRRAVADKASTAQRAGEGNRERIYTGLRHELGDAVDSATGNDLYAQARASYAQHSRAIDAIEAGRNAATRGRVEDTIPAYDAMSSGALGEQGPYRVGYADKLIASMDGAPGVNKVRPLMTDATQAELANMSQHAGPRLPGRPDPMLASIARSNTMFETRARALGGSRTADNLADQEAGGLDPTMIAHVLGHGLGGVVRGGLRAVGNGLTGSTEASRAALAKLLLTHGAGTDVSAVLSPLVQQNIQRAALLRGLGAGAQASSGNLIAARQNAGR